MRIGGGTCGPLVISSPLFGPSLPTGDLWIGILEQRLSRSRPIVATLRDQAAQALTTARVALLMSFLLTVRDATRSEQRAVQLPIRGLGALRLALLVRPHRGDEALPQGVPHQGRVRAAVEHVGGGIRASVSTNFTAGLQPAGALAHERHGAQ